MIREPLLLPVGVNHAELIAQWERQNTEAAIIFYDQRLSDKTRYIGIANGSDTIDILCLVKQKDMLPQYRVRCNGKVILDKGNFFDILREQFPDCFEWFLFHPELL